MYEQVESLTLRATPLASFQSLLGACYSSFPSLKNLKLHFFCGVWNDDTFKLQINLQEYTLERLVVDMTPLYLKQKQSMKRFSVVNVGDQQMYKISLDLSSFTQISSNDLEDLVDGQDYLSVNIIVNGLQSLELLMEYNINADRYKETFDDDDYIFRNYVRSAIRLVISLTDQ